MAEQQKLACIILAAGKGLRMRSDRPKVLHTLAGSPMIGHVLQAALALKPERAVVVVAPGMEAVCKAAREAYSACQFAVQHEALGTGNAVQAAKESLHGFNGTALILFGDTPLITPAALAPLIEASRDAELVVMGMRPLDPTGYGRLVHSASGELDRIVECKEATLQEKGITLCNSGVMAVRVPHLFALLEQIQPQKNGEYYLTDIAAAAKLAKLTVRVAEGKVEEFSGINSRAQLAEAEAAMQRRLRLLAMENGATLIAPETVFLAADTVIGKDSVIQPYVVFGPDVKVGERCVIGPFARLRPGTRLGDEVHIGNFVELKNTEAAHGAKINHLSYVGDSSVGEDANVGAGTITCNYDGFAKYKTEIGAGAFIGSNTSLVAPVKIGDGAIVGAGSVVTADVPPEALAVERSELTVKPGAAQRMKEKKKNK